MKLVIDITIYILKKLSWSFLIFAAVITVTYTVHWVREEFQNEANRKKNIEAIKKNIVKIEKLQKDVEKAVKGRNRYRKFMTTQGLKLQVLKSQYPDRFLHPFDWAFHDKSVKAQEKVYYSAVKGYYNTIVKFNSKKNALSEELKDRETNLKDKESNRSILIQYYERFKDWFWKNISTFLYSLFSIMGLVFLGPPAWKAIWYYIIAPKSNISKSILLINHQQDGKVEYDDSENNKVVSIKAGESLFAKMNWVQKYQEKGHKKSRLFWKGASPFLSYASGLRNLTEIASPSDVPIDVDLAHPEDPHYSLIEVSLKDHPGFVFNPKNIIGLAGNIKVKAYWKIFCLHSWLTNQFRYFTFYGTGKLYLAGYGYVKPSIPNNNTSLLEQHLLIGFDGRLNYKTKRTETFLPYLKGHAELMDDAFEGTFPFFYQGALGKNKKQQIDKHRIWSILGRLFGL